MGKAAFLRKTGKNVGKAAFLSALFVFLCDFFLRETLTHRPPELTKFPMPAVRHENKGNPAMGGGSILKRGRQGSGGGPCQAPLLVSCFRLGWLFSSVLAHNPTAESGPRALARAASRGGASLCWFAVG